MRRRNEFRFGRLWCHLLVGLAILWSAGPDLAAAQSVRIGLAAPLTGPWAAVGQEMQQAAEAAVSVINEHGGLLGRIVTLETRDDGCQPDQARKVAQLFSGTERVDVVIGHCPQVAPAVAEIYHNLGPLFLAPLVPGPELRTFAHSHVFHLGLGADRVGEAAAQKVTDWGKWRRVGIVEDGSRFGAIVAQTLVNLLPRRGVEVVFRKQAGAALDARALSAAAERSQAQLVVFAAEQPPAGQVLSALAAQPADILVVGLPFSSSQRWDEFWSALADRQWQRYVLAPSISIANTWDWEKNLSRLTRDILRYVDDRPSLAQIYLIAAFELIAQAMTETGTSDPARLAQQLRSFPHPTLVGDVRSGETGELRPLMFRLYGPSQPWTPQRAFALEAVKLRVSAPAPAPAKDPILIAIERAERIELAKRNAEIPPEPVYNIEIAPRESANPLVLKPQTPTRLAFSIGPQSPSSIVEGLAPSSALDALAGGKPLPLTVTMDCLLCQRNTHQQQRIVYDPEQRRSETATFEIVPQPEVVEKNSGLGQIIFTVDADGFDLDTLRLDAIVGDPSPQALSAYRPPVKLRLDEIDGGEIVVPDLVIDIAAGGGGKLPVVIRPIHPGLKKRLEEVLGAPSGQSWSFASGLSKADLDDLVAESYGKLRGLVNQNETSLRDLYAALGTDLVLSPQAASLHFSEQDSQKMLEVLRGEGAHLYTQLFKRGDRGLRQALQVIENAEPGLSRPLRVRIRATDVYAPWQLLHPDKDGTIDREKFWGFRYELGIQQKIDAAQGRQHTSLPKPAGDEVVFGAWKGISNHDEVTARAQLLAEHLGKAFNYAIKPIHSRAAFLDQLKNKPGEIKLIVAYGHGKSETDLAPGPQGGVGPVWVQSAAGTFFQFSKEDLLSPRHFDDLIPDEVFEDQLNPIFFKAQPIVLFNACETGTRGKFPMNNNGFVGALTRAGARVVFVTEAPVWNNFSFHFSRDLLDGLLEGKRAAAALRDVRLRHLHAWGNPLGLLYALYGNPAARISP
ncbi:ABC transporter substrate-binding protein [Geoalkalibacter sp.]|uniref:ABC transporter substrate-binding protein n=1 Tax=Geoalkalibacter sp. TaxID=3041440 RepID=UPI00272E0176|nr:ABC transporter substrate-binding protein [Geoalkalibacter sp.]